MPEERYDVVVVGAGPAGLMLAGEVALADRSVLVLEQHPGRSPLSRAFGVHARTLEALDSRGLADELLGTGVRVRRLRLFGRAALDLGRLPSRFPFLLVTPQHHVDRVLERGAAASGARVERGARVTGLRQDGAGVTVAVLGATGAREVRAAYVVGADGAHSTVRHLLGMGFPGRSVLRSIMLADVRLADPPADTLTVNAAGGCFALVAPFGDGFHRVFAWDRRHDVDDQAPLDLEEVRAVTRRALGTDLGMHDARWLGRFHSDERQVARYRRGRVLLVGDAAHVHSPAGGQGMNTGIQDALNLGWKLAAVLDGAPERVLDSYQDERHPVGRTVLRSSGTLIRAAMARSLPARGLRDAAVRTLLAVPPVRERAVGLVSGVGIRYRRPRGAHPLVGARAADVPLADGGRLYEALRRGGWLLLVPGPLPPDAPVRAVRRADAGPAVLVRPDGYVAWAGDAGGPGWRTELDRWSSWQSREPLRTAPARTSARGSAAARTARRASAAARPGAG